MAFTASVTTPSSTLNRRTLVFNQVISNIGNGYNNCTGVFSAPATGTYVFYASAVEHNKQNLQLDIVLNSVPKVRLMGYLSAALPDWDKYGRASSQKGRQSLGEAFLWNRLLDSQRSFDHFQWFYDLALWK